MERNKRLHKRFTLDLIDLTVNLRRTDRVEIIDMSFGGVSLKIDRRIDVGRPFMLKLGNGWNSLEVKGTVVRSEVSGIFENADGIRNLVYTTAIRFDDGSAPAIADFIRTYILE